MAEEAHETEGIIRRMPEALANKIAAGEVVQRPASVAKELIENALDAGAEEITLILKQSGRALVQVVDDGSGMSRADAMACFKRHATSKIQSIDDLERIQTLGFRGEALASIAAVAQVALKTRRVEDAAGTRVRVDGGTVAAPAPCAVPGGTSVAVRNLFYNVPARRSFLKTDATEFKHLVDTFQQLALAEPRVAFSLVHNDNEVFRLSPARAEGFFPALRHRIDGLFGADHARRLVQVEDASSYLSVQGFAGEPELHRRGRDEQSFFVNGRHVESGYLAHAVRAAYEELLPEGAFPFFALFLVLDPRHVDVNVHPTKAEVKFDDQSGVYGFLRSAVRRALRAASLTPQFAPAGEEQGASAFTQAGAAPVSFQPVEATATSGAPARPAGDPAPVEGDPTHVRSLYEAPVEEQEAPAARGEGDAHEAAPLWQLQARYVVTVQAEGLLVIDQRAAHRRVLYERALRRLDQGMAETQQLLFPHTADLSATEAELFEELQPHLRKLGFDAERFGGRTVVVRGVPPDLRVGEEGTALEGLLQQYQEHRDTVSLDLRENLARSLAVRSAVRAGQRLRPEEMRALLDDLFACEKPSADPQGRPTIIRLSPDDLDERFGR